MVNLRNSMGVFALAALATACSDDDAPSFGYDPGYEPSVDAGYDSGGRPVDPPDFENEAFELGTPTASLNFVWIANTTRGTVAKVAVRAGAISIETLRVGADPRSIVATPDDDLALVLNYDSDTLSIIRADVAPDSDEAFTVDILPRSNRVALAPNADAAFVWYDNRSAEEDDAPGELSTLSFVSLDDPPEVAQLSVGFNIREVVFSADGAEAFVVTDDGISRVVMADVAGDGFVPPYPVAFPGEDIRVGADREIVVAEAYNLGLVRIGERATLRLVDLEGDALRDLDLPARATDVDVVPGTPFALVSTRGTDALGVFDMAEFRADAIAPLSWIELGAQPGGQTVVSEDGQRVLAFSAVENSPLVSIVDLQTRGVQTINLRKGVLSAALSPDGRTAVVYHSKAPGTPVAGEPEDEILAKSYAFSIVNMDTGNSKLVRTNAQPGELVFSESGDQAFILIADDQTGVSELEWVDLRTFATTRIDFAELPQHVGLVPGTGMVFISQFHDLGRIAFLDLESGEIREVTGFELNSLIY